MKLRPRSCPGCGSQDDSGVVADRNIDESALDAFAFASRKTPEFMHFRLVRCPDCDLLYANPAPEPDWLANAYRDAAFDAGEASAFAARSYAAALAVFAPHLPDREAALDIGAGDGAFVAELVRAGFSTVLGIEPSAAPVAQASADIRNCLRVGVFRGDEVEPESQSLVTCFQTLEHVDDPVGLFRSAYALLKPRAAFFAVAHDSRALSARLLGRRSPIYDLEHLQIFSPRSLRAALERAGFDRIEIRPFGNTYPLAYWTRLLPIPGAAKTTLARALTRTGLAQRPLSLRAGNQMAVAWKAQ